MGNITTGTISGGTLVCESKKSHEGIDNYFPVILSLCKLPHTPPHRIFLRGSLSGASVPSQIQRSIGQEFADLDSTCSNFDHEEVSSQTIGQMQNYEVDIKNTYLQLSQENSQIVPEKIHKIIEKMEVLFEDVLKKPYIRPFIHREHHDLLWVQDIYK
ncbi:hypothetical protein C2G38_2036004 [Gigaspora rosea]|uniref:Uncharacterized protein n=1 Tax=Gigaspora rosea TaxID=44941 RepID=A0A397VCP7_9GLOM|nr:hypothetical protein C2G38_2036004 [Gigaspora rosea]